MTYDSRTDTVNHKMAVGLILEQIAAQLLHRAEAHDDSKLEAPEKQIFDEFTPLLKTLTYGSDEYKSSLENMGTALQHHYAENRHHPEHFRNGIDDMNLIDLIEMLADWKAATLRHADGNIMASLGINRNRFDISDQLHHILCNTVKDME